MLTKAFELQNQLIEWRRDIHQHPELGFKEVRTANVIAENLDRIGCRVRSGIGRTGVIGELGAGSPIIAIRADMDALPLEETNMVPYASVFKGVMHACGHDAHVAMALGAAQLLSRCNLDGTVRFLFQPAEEVADAEGLSGAPRMIEDGAMQNVNAVISLHVASPLPVGKIEISPGSSSAGVDTFRGAIIGHGGHGSRPHEIIDPFNLAAHVIIALNSIVSRRLDPFAPAVVSLGAIHGGQAENVIPDRIKLDGTIRFMDTKIQSQIHAEIRRAFELTRTLGGDYLLKFEIGTMPMYNHPDAVRLITQTADRLFGKECILPRTEGMGAEDFGCFSDIAPGAMFSLGCQIEGDTRQHHNSNFDIDERCLPYGTAILADAALHYLTTGGFPD
jgi:amidohydrolase